MNSKNSTFHATLFYSYCHKDEKYRESMETSLALLKKEGLLNDWSDQNILPGQSISRKIEEKINESDIMVFLVSQHFIASDECMKEWERAGQIEADKLLFRIPIILTDCAWKDMLSGDDLKALPKDGKPVSNFGNKNTAWHQVYEGIKAVINEMKSTFTPKPEFLEEQKKTDFLAQDHIKLQDIFVFPTLSCRTLKTKDSQLQEEKIINQEQLLKDKYSLIHGEETSGKTALGSIYSSIWLRKSQFPLYI